MGSCISNMFFKTTIGRCFYYKMKHIIDWHGTRRAQMYYYIDVFVVSYLSVRFLSMAYLINNQYKYSAQISYKISRNDPFVSYLYQKREKYGNEVPLMLLAWTLTNFLCQDALYRLNVDTTTWRWWYQLIVINQDDYYQFHMNNFQMIKMVKSIQIANYMNTRRLCSVLPCCIIKSIANLYSQITIRYNLEHIDRKSFFDKKLSILPNFSFKLRSIVVNTLIVSDIFFRWFQLIFGMLI